MTFLQYIPIAIVLIVLIRLTLRPATVMEYQRGLLYTRGRFVKVLEPGKHWLYAPLTVVRLIDVRPKFITIGGQEVLSADGITL